MTGSSHYAMIYRHSKGVESSVAVIGVGAVSGHKVGLSVGLSHQDPDTT